MDLYDGMILAGLVFMASVLSVEIALSAATAGAGLPAATQPHCPGRRHSERMTAGYDASLRGGVEEMPLSGTAAERHLYAVSNRH